MKDIAGPGSLGYTFGSFRLELEGRLLYRGDELVPVPPRAVDLLIAFVEQAGRLLTKDQLLARVWPGLVVEEANLAQNVFVLRKLLGEQEDGRPFIETLPRRGYRFVAPVRPLGAELPAPPVLPLPPPSVPPAAARPRLALGLALALVLAGGLGWLLLGRPGPEKPSPGETRPVRALAVLPIRPLDPAAADGALELGLADALITRLASVPGLVVRPTAAVMRFVGTEPDLMRVARTLDVDAVLEGRWQSQSGQIRLTAQLIEPESGRTLWSGTFDQRHSANLFELEDTLSREVVAALAPKVSWPGASAGPGTLNLEAHRLYLEGRGLTLGLQHLDRAVATLERAVALDSAYAQAWSALAFAHLNSVEILAAPREAQPKAQKAAERALQLDPHQLEARFVLATVAWQYDWNPAQAALGFERVLRERPNDAVAWSHYAFFQSIVGSADAARAAVAKARSLDSASFEVGWNDTAALVFVGDSAAAVAAARGFVALDPGGWLPRLLLARALEAQGRSEEALGELESARKLAPDVAEVWMDLGAALARAGRQNEARAALVELELLAARAYVSPFHRAVITAELGNSARASRELAQAIADRSWYVTWLRRVPQAEALRRLPDYARLTAGLEFLSAAESASRQ